MKKVKIIGAGLAGSEAAWQVAEQGIQVELFEMRPEKMTEAHTSDKFAELVCSNSLGSKLPDRAAGLLKEEIRLLGSKLLEAAENNAVPAGGALAVDRETFAEEVTNALKNHPNIRIVREEAKEIPNGPIIIATGPLTSETLSESIAEFTGSDHLYFFDALAPIVDVETINFDVAFWASRYDRGDTEEGDYINCPLNKEEYYAFVHELKHAERIELKSFEALIDSGVKAGKFFEGCLPVEIIAGRGDDSLAYGPMRPVGLDDPRTGRWPYAVLQLRQDNLAATLYNMVGFQTNLTYTEQKRVFRMIPGLENVEFFRYGQMHRNTFINSPAVLNQSLNAKIRPELFFGGQITGVEGYIGNIATGLVAGLNIARFLQDKSLMEFPGDTMLGALTHYITHAEAKRFQPMKANFGLMPPLIDHKKIKKKERGKAYSTRALASLEKYLEENEI